jgi:hypothetical protein
VCKLIYIYLYDVEVLAYNNITTVLDSHYDAALPTKARRSSCLNQRRSSLQHRTLAS